MVVVAVVAMLLIIATTFKVKERPEFTRVDKPIPLLAAVRYTFTSRSFLILVAANFMSILMQSLILGAIFYLADYVLKMSTMILLACLFIPADHRRAHHHPDPQPSGGGGRAAASAGDRRDRAGARRGGPTALIPVCLALAGFGLSGPQTLTNLLFAQVADEDELRSGVRREGAFFGVNALITKPAQSIALCAVPLHPRSHPFCHPRSE